MEAKDFLEDEDGDLKITGGDWAVGLSDQAHIQDIIEAFPGWYKQFPQIGVGIRSYVNGGQSQELEQAIMIQLTADGYKVNNPRVVLVGSELNISPNAVRI